MSIFLKILKKAIMFLIKSNHDEFKEWKKLTKRARYTSYYIYEGNKGIARVNIEDEVSSDRKYRIGYSRVWILVKGIVVSCSFYEDIYAPTCAHRHFFHMVRDILAPLAGKSFSICFMIKHEFVKRVSHLGRSFRSPTGSPEILQTNL